MGRPSRYALELRERAIRLVEEQAAEHPSQWAAIASIASPGVHRRDAAQGGAPAERDRGQRGGLTTDERPRFKELERENRGLTRTNELVRTASAYFAQAELDGRVK